MKTNLLLMEIDIRLWLSPSSGNNFNFNIIFFKIFGVCFLIEWSILSVAWMAFVSCWLHVLSLLVYSLKLMCHSNKTIFTMLLHRSLLFSVDDFFLPLPFYWLDVFDFLNTRYQRIRLFFLMKLFLRRCVILTLSLSL